MIPDPLFLNKVIAAVLTAALIAMTAGLVTGWIYSPTDLSQNVYIIEVAESEEAVADAPEEPAGPEPITALLASADVAAGEKLAQRACGACHSFDQGGANKTGPAMWDVVNRAKGSVDGYRYSDAMGGFDGVWGYEELNGFIADPKGYMPGTKMSYRGLRKVEDRANMVAYLRTLSASPAALP
ncbi:MAG: c-type cytochrome [Alphaproteobacteria bacterium]|nr:c-type cytochrome [Alphaproteobacteria bacterium]